MAKSLTEHLSSWRADRPDEWTMDEFIGKSLKIEKERELLLKTLGDMIHLLDEIVDNNRLDCHYDKALKDAKAVIAKVTQTERV